MAPKHATAPHMTRSSCMNTLSLVSAALLLSVAPAAWSAECPRDIAANDCVANDLQPTGTEVISGPTACTENEVFSATVRVLFEDGGGANTRYNVGFFVGDNGEPATGGSSCTFDSLQPLGPPFDLTSGSGGFRELNGDACGDIEKAEPTYKDLQLDQLLCQDLDGDGNVDVSYLLTWENNGNRANCTDPLDPAEFEASPPKCRASLDYDLPIAVEKPPSIEVTKDAVPSVLREPGGTVRFPITIINTSPSSSDPVTITRIVDDPFGDISDQTDCALPFTLAPSESRTCYFETSITGVSGDVFPDTVTVFGEDDEGQAVEATDSAEVRILDLAAPRPPGQLSLFKFASPSEIDEPGGLVQYGVVVINRSPTPVVLETLDDDLYGNLDGKGSCSVPQTLSGENAVYFCSFQEPVTGEPGDVITDVITATGADTLPQPTRLTADDSASVVIANVPSSIEVTKTASPTTVTEPGGNVTFTVTIQNTSVADVVTIGTLFDSELGIPGGSCATPITLQPGGDRLECTFSGRVEGETGDFVTNVLFATGTDDDDRPVAGFDAASVEIVGAPPDILVSKFAVPPFALETGSPVTYVVVVQNTSGPSDPVTLTHLEDEVLGEVTNLDGVGTCDLNPGGAPLVLAPGSGPDSRYVCNWVEPGLTPPPGPGGEPLTTLTNTVTAAGEDDEGEPVSASDTATVTFIGEQLNPAPNLQIAKFATPSEVPEPGDEVTFTVLLANGLDSGGNLTVTSLTDEVDGMITDLDGTGTCALPITLPPQTLDQPPVFETCTFSLTVNGNAGDVVTDTVRAIAIDDDSQVANAEASASVTITDVPSTLRVTKTANPSSVLEPGDDVTFQVRVENTSQADFIVLDTLIDNVHGDLVAQGLCPTPGRLSPGRSPYFCEFTAFVGGDPGFEELNTVVATGTDDDGTEVLGSDQASVVVLDTPPSLQTVKSARPSSIPTSGDEVTFTITTTNTSEVDTVTIDSLVDSVFGDLDGQGDCSVPQVLAPGETYQCRFTERLSGDVGETHLDEVFVTGTSDDGDAVASRANAIVTFVFIARSVPVAGATGLALLALMMLLIGGQRLRNRSSR